MESKQEKGVHAKNQDFIRYDQVNKEQVYNLSESEGVEEFDEEFEIQTCDMTGLLAGDPEAGDAFAQQFGSALEEIGFAVLTGHGVDRALYDEATEKVIELFEKTTLEERMAYLAQRHGSVNQGYFPMKETTIIHPDLVEGWVFCRRALNMDGSSQFDDSKFWPKPGFEPFFRQLCLAHQRLILPIMQSILKYLGSDVHCYDEKLTGTNFGFRINYYPTMSSVDSSAGGSRMLGHEDVDLFTILPAANVDGLQVLNRRNMKWIHLSPPQGSIIINTGDYMQRITNDRLPSSTHRVAKPRTTAGDTTPRISVPMAVYVWEHETLEVLPELGEPKYPPINAEEFHTRITSKYYGDDYASTEPTDK